MEVSFILIVTVFVLAMFVGFELITKDRREIAALRALSCRKPRWQRDVE